CHAQQPHPRSAKKRVALFTPLGSCLEFGHSSEALWSAVQLCTALNFSPRITSRKTHQAPSGLDSASNFFTYSLEKKSRAVHYCTALQKAFGLSKWPRSSSTPFGSKELLKVVESKVCGLFFIKEACGKLTLFLL